MKVSPKKYLIAVSGGVDSVVLLEMLAKKHENILVAHFDHGIREDSKEDAIFVRQLAVKYGVKFFTKREELGANASEEKARRARYKFLRELSEKQNATIVTAHHLDDVVETIIINMVRGTGWRGLAVLNAEDIYRPLINFEKQEIINYAKQNNLKWREDSTNSLNVYMRNIVRHKIDLNNEQKNELQILHQEQIRLAKEIKSEVTSLLKSIKNDNKISRYFINSIDQASAYEIIRELTKGELTPSQIDSVINAIKTQRNGTIFEASKNIKIHFTTRFFTLELIK
ncbi:tRNA lysidine(34) synthetase TilS [Candidatus Saccharibacteria bacterium]|nr:tRNA lysidine(34) synthetase TilS [Candidatus Saccharibacteria bacterium]MBP9985861.1 tRNA lysidine(34) synthetase TilS [Candidatus Saccharibacteria bacterium]